MKRNPQDPPGLPTPRGFSQSMKWAGIVFVSGQLPLDVSGSVVSDDFRIQCRQVFRNIQVALESQDATLGDIVMLTVYLTNMDMYEAFREVRKEVLQEPFPTSTLIGVTGLAVDRALLEIEVLAAST